MNLFAPGILYQRFNSLRITNMGYDPVEVAAIRQRLAEEMQRINITKLEAMFFTDIYTALPGCSTCKNPCRIPTVLPEFQKTYEKVSNRIFTLLEMIDSYIDVCNRNAIKRAFVTNCQELNQQLQACGRPLKYEEAELNGYESEIIDVESQQNDIIAALTEVSKYNQAEIPQLNVLAREYITAKQQNTYRKHFGKKD